MTNPFKASEQSVSRSSLRADFDPHLLDKTHVAIPIATINREARGAALFWMRQKLHASEVRYCEDHRCSVFARVFDRRRDTLYIEANELMAFSWNPIDRLLDHGLPVKDSTITRLAISETSFRNLDFATFGMILDGAPDTNVVLVVVGAQPRCENNGLNVQRRWVAEDAGAYRLSWDLSRQRVEVAAGQGSGNTVEYAWMKAVCDTWIEWLVQQRPWRSVLSMQSGRGPVLAEMHDLTNKWPTRFEPPYGCRSAEPR